ncbi:transmembrane emp24 domain-containing protein 1-like [Erpetoichthys calabaricus]|uniref:Transmembrane p24 trafficking protein 1b n=1 Tax=Erpetoichthys calabaricus TaxID=27687 RepID=A0A8C4TDP0_ERPCA|nr:transmembrane emp24 domain-containing protein 1-like [Erpetoichthys calabaricus]
MVWEGSAGLYMRALCVALYVALAASFTQPRDSEFTFILPAGRIECFYQKTEKNVSMEVEYQVIAGAGMDVDFSISSPQGVILYTDFRRSDGMHTIDSTDEGDYQLCFDNTFSKFSEKMVFFEVIFDSPQEGQDDWSQMVPPEELLDYKLEDIRESIESTWNRLERSVQIQTVLRAFEARDRNLQEDNLWRVTFWSATNMLVLVIVALVQVYMLRSLFDDKRRVRT